MAMKWKLLDIVRDKLAEYLPPEEPVTEQDKLYEEGKKRVYEMHQREKDLFYASQAWLEGTYGKVCGETAKGIFCLNDPVIFLDVHGNPLLYGEILGIEEEEDKEKKIFKENAKEYLLVRGEELSEKEDFFVQTFYIIKKH